MSKTLHRDALQRFIRNDLGLDPYDVLSVDIHATYVDVVLMRRDADGRVILVGNEPDTRVETFTIVAGAVV